MKRFLKFGLPLMVLLLISSALSAQYNLTRNECEMTFSHSGGGADIATLSINHLVFDSTSTTKAIFQDKLNKQRFSLEISKLDSISYQGALDTIADVTTALGTATNMLTLITVVEGWQSECEFKSFNPELLFYGTGSPEGAVTAPLGAIYINLSGGAGTTIYAKESGNYTNTGWSGL